MLDVKYVLTQNNDVIQMQLKVNKNRDAEGNSKISLNEM